jgi:hypothetical protein
MKATLRMFGKPYKVILETTRYQDGNLAVQAIDADDGDPFCTISVNLPESDALPDGAFYAKHWSENETFIDQLVDQKILVPVPAPPASSGFVSDIRAYAFAK